MQMTSDQQLIMDHALEMVLAFDWTGRILFANRVARERLEYGDRILSCTIQDIFPQEVEIENGRITDIHEHGTELSEVMAYRENRTCFPVIARLRPLEEQPDVILCFAFDNSVFLQMQRELDRSKDEVHQAEKTKSEFVANVTHELRTPVNGILGNTKELEELETDREKLRRLQLIHRGCDDMHALINGILDFSKLDAGKLDLEKREFEFRPMIDYLRSNHQPKITEKGVDFVVSVSPEVPKNIVGDELRIKQIINNLLSNATKFTSIGRITLEVYKTAQSGNQCELFFIVRDTGVGIKEEDQGKLFRSFTQVDASVTREYGGTGLGLNISKQLVALMQGDINLQSEYGKGSTFSFNIWVDLPKEEAESGQGRISTPVLTADPESTVNEAVWTYGSPENKEELKKKLSKLSLSVDMENWEKAEMFAETVKQLLQEAPAEIRPLGLRMKMSVQKADREKALEYLEKLEAAIDG